MKSKLKCFQITEDEQTAYLLECYFKKCLDKI